jgi:hypothetical protein
VHEEVHQAVPQKIYFEDGDVDKNRSSIWDVDSGLSVSNASVPQSSVNNDDGELDIFGDEDENTDPSRAQTGTISAHLLILNSSCLAICLMCLVIN